MLARHRALCAEMASLHKGVPLYQKRDKGKHIPSFYSLASIILHALLPGVTTLFISKSVGYWAFFEKSVV